MFLTMLEEYSECLLIHLPLAGVYKLLFCFIISFHAFSDQKNFAWMNILFLEFFLELGW